MTTSPLPQPGVDRAHSTISVLSKLSDADLQKAETATQFREAVQTLADHIRDKHDIDESSRPNLTVTHYTSLDALFSMLENNDPRLRLYDTVHLNDPLEGIATAEGKSLANDLSSPGASSLDEGLSRFSTGYLVSFLASYSEKEAVGDNLVFWRLYGRDGRGCSISFAPFRTAWPNSVRNALRCVCYDPNSLPDYSSEMLGLLKLLRRFQGIGDLQNLAQHQLSLAEPLLDECLARRFLVKEPSYRLENEVRLVRFAPKSNSSSQGPFVELVRGAIRHYLEDDNLKLQKLVDTRTVLRLGPAVPNPEDAKRALRRLWSKKNLPHIKIETSKIEYRPSP